jgi:ATP-binding protein involved in chromosome partitioning
MSMDKDTIRGALGRVPYAGSVDVASAGALSKVSYCDGHASIRIAGGRLSPADRAALSERITLATRAHARDSGEQVEEVHVEVTDEAPTAAARHDAPTGGGHRPIPIPPKQGGAGAEKTGQLPGVKHIIAVGAGKGGVGKSTVAVNLAVGLARRGHAVGLMDGDIYGPSLPTMLGLTGLEVNVRGSMIQPLPVHGLKAMTIGKLVEPDKPLIWRGPMAHGAFKQLVEQTAWGELDYLIIDLPPGTGDVALTMAQLLRLTGAVVVCTPQKVAQDDAVRAARMFQQLGIEVLGVVENMSWFVGDDGKEYDIFGRGGAKMMAQRLGLPFLGAVPINMALREHSDSGDPTANFTDRSERNRPLVEALERLVANVEGQVAMAAMRQGLATPTLSIS